MMYSGYHSDDETSDLEMSLTPEGATSTVKEVTTTPEEMGRILQILEALTLDMNTMKTRMNKLQASQNSAEVEVGISLVGGQVSHTGLSKHPAPVSNPDCDQNQGFIDAVVPPQETRGNPSITQAHLVSGLKAGPPLRRSARLLSKAMGRTEDDILGWKPHIQPSGELKDGIDGNIPFQVASLANASEPHATGNFCDKSIGDGRNPTSWRRGWDDLK